MGYFNVTNAPAKAIDGKDVAITKSINMVDWQANLTKSLQKANPHGKVTTTTPAAGAANNANNGMAHEMEQHHHQQQPPPSSSPPPASTNKVSIVQEQLPLGTKHSHQTSLESKLEVLLHGLTTTTICIL